MRAVLGHVMDTPQNNIRVFRGGRLVAPLGSDGATSSSPSCAPLVDADLTDLFGSAPGTTPSGFLADLLTKVLQQPATPDGGTVLEAVQTMQRLEVDIETLYPAVKEWLKGHVLESEPRVVDLVKMAHATCPPKVGTIHCQSSMQKGLRGETDTAYEALGNEYQAQRSNVVEGCRGQEAGRAQGLAIWKQPRKTVH